MRVQKTLTILAANVSVRLAPRSSLGEEEEERRTLHVTNRLNRKGAPPTHHVAVNQGHLEGLVTNSHVTREDRTTSTVWVGGDLPHLPLPSHPYGLSGERARDWD